MKIHLVIAVVLAAHFAIPSTFGQCPPAKASGYHVVQKGETLYSISRKYGVPVQDLLRWNSMAMSDVLHVCRELRVSATPGTANTSGTSGTSNSNASAQPTGAVHTVKSGEKVANIAAIYGWTEWRFRKMNNLTPWQEVSPGVKLKTDDCACPPAGTSPPTAYEAQQPAIISGSTIRPAEEVVLEIKKDSMAHAKDTISAVPTAPRTIASFMKPAELAMADEINLLRANPKGYIPFIEQHKEEIRAGRVFGSVETADELIAELKNSPSLSLLDPMECLYTAAKKHADEQLPNAAISHVGKDGSWPWDRVKRECPTLTDGNENLIGGLADVREAVITLLLDEGIPTRGHRRVLLNPIWKHMAVYYVGPVGATPHNWVQLFGR